MSSGSEGTSITGSTAPLAQINEWMTHAIACHQRQEFALAETLYRRVLGFAPSHPDATHYLGLLWHQTGHADDGLPLLCRSVTLDPNKPLYWHNLAGVYKERQEFAEAERCYRRVLALDSGYLDAWVGLGIVESEQGRYAAALDDHAHVLAVDSRHFAAGMRRAGVLHEIGNDDEAASAYLALEDAWIHDARKLQAIGAALRDAGRTEDAAQCFERALSIAPDSLDIRNALGNALADLGKLNGAQACYRTILRVAPTHVRAFYNLANLVRLSPADQICEPLTALAGGRGSLTLQDRTILHFALGKVWEDAADYDRAFNHFRAGNRLKRTSVDYDESRQIRFIANCMHSFDAGFIATHAGIGEPDDTPIFIIGMSRSGTSLVEQILASHSMVYGAGESQQLWRCIRSELGTTPRDDDYLPALLRSEGDSVFRRVAARYMAALRKLAPSAGRITDKLPGNITLVGLVHIAFPNARIIHCVRDPLDTCLSCYSKLFTSGHLFSYELGELGRYYRAYETLMRHWNAVLPAGCMLEVHYEDVAADVETQARRLLTFCGLPWEDNCLKFYGTERAVRTASLAQVRRPIYTASVGRWKHYAKYLEPLRHALQGRDARM